MSGSPPHGVAAIHQPNFFPWLGYFDKIARADVFIVLDDVQCQKTGSNWSNRVKLLVAGEPQWVTAPVSRPPHGVQTLAEARWAGQPWREKLVKLLRLNYGKAPFHAEAMALVEPLVLHPEPGLAAYNLHGVRVIASALGLRDNFVLASDFGVETSSTERLVELVRRAGCRRYLAGGGAGGYQDDAQFAAAGLGLEYQSFVHPAYAQHGAAAFHPGMSIIDALMNCGVARTHEFLAR